MSESLPNRRSGDGLVQVIAARLENLSNDMGDTKSVLRELTAAVTKLAVIEERQGQAAQALERAFKVLEKVEARLDALERVAPMQAQTSDWVGKIVWAAAAAAGMLIAKKAGLL